MADPRSKDPEHGDFTLGPDSPAHDLGFEPLDPGAAGRRTPPQPTAGLPPVPTIWLRARKG